MRGGRRVAPGESRRKRDVGAAIPGDFERGAYWHELHALLLDGIDAVDFPALACEAPPAPGSG